jgi:branched-chain amino acid transport system ATP-binding protein
MSVLPVTVLEARDLRKRFGGVRAVDGVSFSVEAGERVALIGPNGAGKTTCFNLLNGHLEPDSGKAFLDGTDITGRPPRELARLGVGRTFQVAETFASMTVIENIEVVSPSGSSLLKPLLNQLGIERQADQLCSTLSYGDLKRVELAMALAARPKLLLMDEPTAGMAAGERESLMIFVEKLSRQEGIAVLFTEHDMDVVFGFATRIVVLHQGKIVASGTPAEIRSNPKVREVYLGDYHCGP